MITRQDRIDEIKDELIKLGTSPSTALSIAEKIVGIPQMLAEKYGDLEEPPAGKFDKLGFFKGGVWSLVSMPFSYSAGDSWEKVIGLWGQDTNH